VLTTISEEQESQGHASRDEQDEDEVMEYVLVPQRALASLNNRRSQAALTSVRDGIIVGERTRPVSEASRGQVKAVDRYPRLVNALLEEHDGGSGPQQIANKDTPE
jgi:hypothetical protein